MIDYRAPLDELPDPLPIVPLEKPFDVTITPPGSKSITNRAYVLAALADGESKIIRPLRSEDTDALLDALCSLGAEARWEGDDVFIKGVAGRFPRGGSVNLGDGGTPTRFMIAAACLAAEPVVVDGSPRMRERPIAEGVEMLRQLGAKIEYVEEEGRLPVRVVPSEDFKGGKLTIGKTASSQFISAVMLIGPWLERGIKCEKSERLTSERYIWLTCEVMWKWEIDYREFGWPVERDSVVERKVTDWGSKWKRWMGVPAQIVSAQEFTVEPDASSGLYWYLGASIINQAKATVPGFDWDSAQPDVYLLSVLESIGPMVQRTRQYERETMTVIGSAKMQGGNDIDCSDSPDGAMAMCVALSCADGPSTITGLHTLRVKETDRIAALANELRKVGCTVETTDDSISITPPSRDRPPVEPGANGDVVIETYNDHRMAMSFAILGLVRPGLAIRNPKCVAKSYPTFWKDFAKLYESPR
jgi:3-phosphoshikimate 1-carboxyvinyltransferase